MTELQQMINMLMQLDRRVLFHTYKLQGGTFTHLPEVCAKCQCEMIMREEINIA